MTQNVAVEDKVADVRPAEIDERRDTGKMDDLNSRPRVEPESYPGIGRSLPELAEIR